MTPFTFTGTGLNAETEIPIYACWPSLPGPSVGCGDALSVHPRTDAAASFVLQIPFASTAPNTDSLSAGFPSPEPVCASTLGCVVFALTQGLPEGALTVAVQFDLPVTTTTTTTTTTVSSPDQARVSPVAAPVAAAAPFTG